MDPITRYASAPHPYGAEEPDQQPLPVFSSTEDDAGVPLHPDAKRLFDRCSALRRIPLFGEACEAYGPRCTISLGLCYLLCKGISDQIFVFCRYPMLQVRFGIESDRYQRLSSIGTSAWSIKAFTAVICDAFAFLGYTKRWYMFASCVAGSVFALLYGLLPAKPSSGNVAAAFIFLSTFGKANVDILSEGYYSRLMRKIPKAGPALVSWIWWFIIIGSLVASALQGPLSDLKLPQVGVFISAALQLLTCLIFLFNMYGEKTNREERDEDARIMHRELLHELEKKKAQCRKEEEEGGLDVIQGKALELEPFGGNETLALADDLPMSVTHTNQQQAHELKDHTGASQDEASPELLLPQPITCCCGLIEFNKEIVTRNKRVVVYGAVMTASAIAMTIGNILADTLGLLIICVVVSVVCSAMSFWALPRIIAKVNVMAYFNMMLYIQLPSLLDGFYLAESDCLPDGPHFSNTFYNTVAVGIIGNIAALIGITAFKYIFSTRSYRLALVVTTLLWISASIFDITMLQRWNVKIGIPDHVMYICGDAIIGQVCYMLAWMPMTILLSRLCPRGSESTVYALLAGFSNLGQSTSSSIGAILIEYVWPIRSNPPCDFSNGVWLIVVGHVLTPLLIIPMTLLLPNARVSDDIDIDGNVIPKETREAPRTKPVEGSNEHQ